tara:strand:- start:1115 stop:1390 length:276 start_codon:yes stop_codon:yes gene_type:complete
MCVNLKPPKPPPVPKQAPLPIIKQPPPKPRDIQKPKLIKQEADKETKVEYGSKPSDALLANKRTNKSIVNLNKNALNTAGANQQGLGGTAA